MSGAAEEPVSGPSHANCFIEPTAPLIPQRTCVLIVTVVSDSAGADVGAVYDALCRCSHTPPRCNATRHRDLLFDALCTGCRSFAVALKDPERFFPKPCCCHLP